jgi:heme-degrading monooxygenase HmoA
MIKHVVMWKFKEGTEAAAEKFMEGLRSLDGVIPEILEMEVAKSAVPDSEYDAILVSKFESLEALNAYKVNPKHVAVADMCRAIRVTRVAFDYEV